MKRIFILAGLLIPALLLVLADVVPLGQRRFAYEYRIWQNSDYTAYRIDDDPIWIHGKTLTAKGTEYTIDDIDSITIGFASYQDWDTLEVWYAGEHVTVSPLPEGVTVSIDGARVEVNSQVTDRELCVVLGGESPSGHFIYNGSYKVGILMKGLTLTADEGATVDIRCGKRIALQLAEGTVNTLADAKADGGQKAALYTKGHLEVSGGGTLNLTGHVKHALAAKEYVLVKKTTGAINILGAAGDGIHAGQYFRMNGGTLTLTDIAGDGIQAEATDDPTDEDNGRLTIAGGRLDIVLTGNDVAALKSDSQLTVSGGDIAIRTTGAAVKGLKSKADVAIEGGTIEVTQQGELLDTGSDVSYTTAIKADGDVRVTGGRLTIVNKADAGKGISADGHVNISEATGTTTIDIRGDGAGIDTADGYTAKGISGDAGVAIDGGTVSIAMTGAGGKGIKTDGAFTMGRPDGSGPDLSVTTSGSRLGGTSGGGKPRFAPRFPTHEQLIGATMIPVEVADGPVEGFLPPPPPPEFDAPWAGGFGPRRAPGGPGPGGPGGSGGGSSAKAIKAEGTATLLGGTLTVKTSTDGAEGLESKTAVNIVGGRHYLECYDDCINSAGNITFDGGVTVCYSSGNDAVDSNANRAGAITIGNGTVLAFTTKGSPEEGLDCDNNSYIRITGTGIALSAGGVQGGSSSSTISNAAQGYTFHTGTVAYQPNRYYTLADAAGNNLVTYSFPVAFNSTLSLFTATGMVKGSTYSVKYSTAEPTDAALSFHGLYLGSSHQGTTAVCSFTAK